MTMREFRSVRPAYGPDGTVTPTEIVVRAHGGPEAARLVREAQGERAAAWAHKGRSDTSDGPERHRKDKRSPRKAKAAA